MESPNHGITINVGKVSSVLGLNAGETSGTIISLTILRGHRTIGGVHISARLVDSREDGKGTAIEVLRIASRNDCVSGEAGGRELDHLALVGSRSLGLLDNLSLLSVISGEVNDVEIVRGGVGKLNLDVNLSTLSRLDLLTSGIKDADVEETGVVEGAVLDLHCLLSSLGELLEVFGGSAELLDLEGGVTRNLSVRTIGDGDLVGLTLVGNDAGIEGLKVGDDILTELRGIERNGIFGGSVRVGNNLTRGIVGNVNDDRGLDVAHLVGGHADRNGDHRLDLIAIHIVEGDVGGNILVDLNNVSLILDGALDLLSNLIRLDGGDLHRGAFGEGALGSLNLNLNVAILALEGLGRHAGNLRGVNGATLGIGDNKGVGGISLEGDGVFVTGGGVLLVSVDLGGISDEIGLVGLAVNVSERQGLLGGVLHGSIGDLVADLLGRRDLVTGVINKGDLNGGLLIDRGVLAKALLDGSVDSVLDVLGLLVLNSLNLHGCVEGKSTLGSLGGNREHNMLLVVLVRLLEVLLEGLRGNLIGIFVGLGLIVRDGHRLEALSTMHVLLGGLLLAADQHLLFFIASVGVVMRVGLLLTADQDTLGLVAGIVVLVSFPLLEGAHEIALGIVAVSRVMVRDVASSNLLALKHTHLVRLCLTRTHKACHHTKGDGQGSAGQNCNIPCTVLP